MAYPVGRSTQFPIFMPQSRQKLIPQIIRHITAVVPGLGASEAATSRCPPEAASSQWSLGARAGSRACLTRARPRSEIKPLPR